MQTTIFRVILVSSISETRNFQLNLDFSAIGLPLGKARISTIHGSPAELDGSEIRSKVSAKGPSVWIIK
jgi:hypothetical protein